MSRCLDHCHLRVKGINLVVNQVPLGMSHVGLSELDIFLPRFLNSFVPCIISGTIIELLSTIRSCYQMEDSIVPLVSELYGGYTKLIHETLPLDLVHVSTPVHETSINQDYCFLYLCYHQTQLSERLLQSNLQSKERFLELESLVL